MKVVIDTNVLVSAALKDKDPEAVIPLCVTICETISTNKLV